MQRESNLPLHRHFVHRRMLRSIQPVQWHTVTLSLGAYGRIVRIEKDGQLGLVEILGILYRRSRLYAVCVIQHDTQVADAPNAGFRTDSGLSRLNTRETENTFFRFSTL